MSAARRLSCGLAHFGTIQARFGNNSRQIAGTRKLLDRGGGNEVRGPDGIAGIGDDETLELDLKLRNRLQCREDVVLKVRHLRLRLDRVRRSGRAAPREADVALLLRNRLSQRLFLDRDVAPSRNQIPIRIFYLRDRIRSVDHRLSGGGVGIDERQLQLALRCIHAGVPEQRLRHREVQRRDIVRIVRVENGVVIRPALLDAGLIRHAVLGLTADAVLRRPTRAE